MTKTQCLEFSHWSFEFVCYLCFVFWILFPWFFFNSSAESKSVLPLWEWLAVD